MLSKRTGKLQGMGKRVGYFAAARCLKNRGYTLDQVLALLYAGIL